MFSKHKLSTSAIRYSADRIQHLSQLDRFACYSGATVESKRKSMAVPAICLSVIFESIGFVAPAVVHDLVIRSLTLLCSSKENHALHEMNVRKNKYPL